MNKCSKLDPNDARPIRAVYDIHIITKQYDEANADIGYLLWLDPKDEDALSAKELLKAKIHYYRVVNQFPLYS